MTRYMGKEKKSDVPDENFFSTNKISRKVMISAVISWCGTIKLFFVNESGIKVNKEIFFLFFNWDSIDARLNSHYEAWSYKKKAQKRLQDTENIYRKNLYTVKKRCVLILDLKPLGS